MSSKIPASGYRIRCPGETVPPASMFVMGDNRANSRDSRYHLDLSEGAVPESNAVGRVVLVVWPFSRLALESIPSIFNNPALG